MTKRAIMRLVVDEKTTVYVNATQLSGEEDVSIKGLDFERVSEAVTAVSKRFAAVFAAVKPDKAKIEFGVEVAAEAGKLMALLVDGKGTATFKVTLEWTSNDRDSANK